MSNTDENKKIPEDVNKEDYEILDDCTSVMNPEMARNYEENEPCNDGTLRRKTK